MMTHDCIAAIYLVHNIRVLECIYELMTMVKMDTLAQDKSRSAIYQYTKTYINLYCNITSSF